MDVVTAVTAWCSPCVTIRPLRPAVTLWSDESKANQTMTWRSGLAHLRRVCCVMSIFFCCCCCWVFSAHQERRDVVLRWVGYTNRRDASSREAGNALQRRVVAQRSDRQSIHLLFLVQPCSYRAAAATPSLITYASEVEWRHTWRHSPAWPALFIMPHLASSSVADSYRDFCDGCRSTEIVHGSGLVGSGHNILRLRWVDSGRCQKRQINMQFTRLSANGYCSLDSD